MNPQVVIFRAEDLQLALFRSVATLRQLDAPQFITKLVATHDGKPFNIDGLQIRLEMEGVHDTE